MKSRYALAVAMIAIALLGASYLISQDAALVSSGLTALKFESVPGKPGLVGAPPRLKVTQKTLDYLARLMKDGKTIQVGNDGAITVVDPAK